MTENPYEKFRLKQDVPIDISLEGLFSIFFKGKRPDHGRSADEDDYGGATSAQREKTQEDVGQRHLGVLISVFGVWV